MKIWVVVAESGSCPSDISTHVSCAFTTKTEADEYARRENTAEAARLEAKRNTRSGYWLDNSTDFCVEETELT